MYNHKLKYNPNPTFLGITFDQRLTFQKHVENVKKKCTNRLNCIKIISNKSWALKQSTQTAIYTSLIRSIMDHSSLILTRLSKKRLKQLQSTQNAAARAIYKLPYNFSSADLNDKAKLPSLAERMRQLNVTYCQNTILNENLLFEELLDDYENMNLTHLKKLKTFSCDMKNDLN
ncbi:RNA-directed DNA polymerase from mobile element jockey-like [Brachionus plicatilis]|uniref:RNA-directed DNA polymerase from mobile element jockey-like n=1 Tax=Brachionus plicatilis TaxID=10195 RepID=A0A3M7PHA0_BRAPC|nr:RNA-directed DNA polymerase from mobile element jockey-like [Brachionus plicatilis]